MKLEASLKHFSPQGMLISGKEQERETTMRDMYEVMDRWGAWLRQTAVVLTGNLLPLGLRGYYLTAKNHAFNVTTMRVS
ncbi:Uncharacterised protein [Citrobacter youngae]|nr:Uncharacterised protein [Citrobacter youngae]